MFVFENKHPVISRYRTDSIPLNQTATFKIKYLNCSLKDCPACLAFCQPKIKTKINFSGYL